MKLFFWIGLLFLFSCKSKPEKQPIIQLSPHQSVIFLDSTAASMAIIKDEKEHFFEKISKLDMAIQIKEQFPKDIPRDTILEAYKSFLQQDVESFTSNEIFLIEGIMQRLYKLTLTLNPNIFPVEIRLIKTKGRHYGDGVFYTRENCIIIPENELEEFSPDIFIAVMAHELAHIYTRYHPEVKEALYALIGFKKLNCTTEELKLPEELAPRILLNPDGIDYTYAVRLRAGRDSSFRALPIIAANNTVFEPENPEFFNYIDFQLYPVLEKGYQQFEVIHSGYGDKAINPYFREDFLIQIKDNTDYIIHPDEIIADNFKLLLLSGTSKLQYDTERLSVEGKRLLNEIEVILMNE